MELSGIFRKLIFISTYIYLSLLSILVRNFVLREQNRTYEFTENCFLLPMKLTRRRILVIIIGIVSNLKKIDIYRYIYLFILIVYPSDRIHIAYPSDRNSLDLYYQ